MKMAEVRYMSSPIFGNREGASVVKEVQRKVTELTGALTDALHVAANKLDPKAAAQHQATQNSSDAPKAPSK
jgi:hypothetical protein